MKRCHNLANRSQVRRFELREACSGFFHYLSQLLVKDIVKCEGPILDLGCGTYNSSLAIGQKFKDEQIVAIDNNAEMLNLGQVKLSLDMQLGQNKDVSSLEPTYRDYLPIFQEKADEVSLKSRLATICGDILQIEELINTKFALVVGNFVWHHFMQQEIDWNLIQLLNKITVPKGIVAINSSDPYILPIFNKMESDSIYCNPLIASFFRILIEKKKQKESGPNITYPQPPIAARDDIIDAFRRGGFRLIKYEEDLVNVQEFGKPLDPTPFNLLCNHYMRYFPFCFDIFTDSALSFDEQDKILSEARLEALTHMGSREGGSGLDLALNCTQMNHICPRFIFEKIGESL